MRVDIWETLYRKLTSQFRSVTRSDRYVQIPASCIIIHFSEMRQLHTVSVWNNAGEIAPYQLIGPSPTIEKNNTLLAKKFRIGVGGIASHSIVNDIFRRSDCIAPEGR